MRAPRFLVAVSILSLLTALPGLSATTPGAQGPAASIPFAELGAKATADYKGDAIRITPTAQGAELRTGFQQLTGHATSDGLWLESTEAEGGRLRLTASVVRRARGPATVLPPAGTVAAGDKTVSFTRPGLVEEYSVSADGLRQDFIIAERPQGTGDLRVDLNLTGARATSTHAGVRLTLAGSGRMLSYSRLRVVDATGRELAATLEAPSHDRLTVSVSDTAATYPVRIDPTFSDADWVSLNSSVPGANAYVKAMTVAPNGDVYVGGDFNCVGDVAANRVAKWNGSVWASLGQGITEGSVTSLAMRGTDLIVGGFYRKAGGQFRNCIACWNGTAWSSLGTGVGDGFSYDLVTALAVNGTDVYAVGGFTQAGGQPANHVAKWNGTEWSQVGPGVQSSNIVALAVMGGDVYVGGYFEDVNGIPGTCGIARWNGTAWTSVGGGAAQSSVTALTASGGSLYMGGSFSQVGGVENTSGIARWNGTAWSALGTGISSGPVYALAVSGSDLYAGGGFQVADGAVHPYIAKWNGTEWSSLGTSVDSNVQGLAVSGGQVFAGGQFQTAGDVTASYLARWNGSAWSALGAPGMDGQVSALAFSGSDLYAGGYFNTASGVVVNRIAKWNGSVWSPLGTGINGGVTALAVKGSVVYAGGDFRSAGGVPARCVAKWDGSTWSALGSGIENLVYGLAISGDDLYVGGNFSAAGGVPASNIAKWNGSEWSALGSGTDGTVQVLAADGTTVYAGGYFSHAGDLPASNIAKWNGTDWSALGAGVDSEVADLAVSQGKLYAGGYFSSAGGMPASYVAQWNGSSWSALGSGANGVVLALAVKGPDLYIGGHTLSQAGGVPVNFVACWNGSVWSAIGSGTDSHVRAMAAGPTSVAFAGEFVTAGDKYSPYVAQLMVLFPEIAVELPGGVDLTDDTSTVPYGSVLVDTVASKTFTIKNTGQGFLKGLTIAIDGVDAGDFDVTSPPTAPVAPGGSTTFTLAFSPTTLGPRTAALHISSNDEDENTFDFALTGTSFGIPDLEVEIAGGGDVADGGSMAYDNVVSGGTKVASLILTNTGSEALTGLHTGPISGSGAARFSITGALPGTTLAQGASTTLSVTYTAAAAGASTALLQIFSDDPDESPYDLTLTGTSIAVSPQEIGVQYPEGVELVDNVSTVPFGSVLQGIGSTITFTIANSGTQPLTGLALGTVGAAPDFILGTLPVTSLGFEQSTTFTVTFLPTALGARTGTIKVVSNDANEGIFEIKLTGTGIAPEIAVELAGVNLVDGTGSVSFGTGLVPGTPVIRTLTIKNSGTAPLNLTNAIIDGTHAGDFQIGNPGTMQVAAGLSTTVNVTMTPTASGVRTAALHIVNDDGNESPFDLKLTGTAAAPELDVEQPAGTALVTDVSTVNFGPALQATNVLRTFTIKNSGASPLTGIAVTRTGADLANFTVTTAPAATVAAKGSTTFVVKFTPTALRDFSATLQIASNDFDENPFVISITGEGVTELKPVFLSHPESQIVYVGTPVTFSAGVDSPVTFTRQWRKGTTATTLANIAGAVAASYTLAAAKLTDATSMYGLRATNASGFADSTPARLTVVDGANQNFNLAVGAKATFTASAAGSSTLTYQWLKNGKDLPVDSDYVVSPPNKLVVSNLADDDAATYTCEVTGPGGTLTGGEIVLTVFDSAPVISPDPVVMDAGIVSGDYSFFIPLSDAGGSATTFTAAPLPAGLKLNTVTGEIYGKPTTSKASAYTLTVTAKNSKGTDTAPASILISPLPPGTDGDYVGIVVRGDADDHLGGRLDLKITPTGSYTGKAVIGGKTYTLPAGSVSATADNTVVTFSATVPRASLPSLFINGSVNTPLSRIDGGVSVTPVSPAPPIVQGVRGSRLTGWKNTWKTGPQATQYDDYYTFALDRPGNLAGNADIPQGVSFGSFKVPLKGESFAIAGRTADGDTFTSSAFLGPDGDLALYCDLASKGTLVGIMDIAPGTGPAYNDNTLSGNVSWSRPASALATANTYKEGFQPINLTITGGRYVGPSATTIVMGKAPGTNNAAVTFFDAGIGGPPSRADRSFTLIPGASVTIAASGPSLTTLKFTTATGAVSGGFTLVDSHPVTPSAPRITRKVTFQGMIVPTEDGPVGFGFFLMSQLPTAVFPQPPVLPVLSGAAVVE